MCLSSSQLIPAHFHEERKVIFCQHISTSLNIILSFEFVLQEGSDKPISQLIFSIFIFYRCEISLLISLNIVYTNPLSLSHSMMEDMHFKIGNRIHFYFEYWWDIHPAPTIFRPSSAKTIGKRRDCYLSLRLPTGDAHRVRWSLFYSPDFSSHTWSTIFDSVSDIL